MQAMLKLVAECSAEPQSPAPGPMSESPLKIALLSLSKMCAYSQCKQFLRSSELFAVIVKLRQSPEKEIAKYAIEITAKVSNG